MQYRCFVGICLGLLFLTPASGQMGLEITVNSSIDGEEQFQMASEMVRTCLEFHLDSRIAKMNEICELTPKQIAKLNIAKRLGAIDFMGSFDETNRKNLVKRQKALGYEFNEDGQPIWNEGIDPKVSGSRFVLNCPPIENIELRWKWRKTYQKVLTETQRKVWKEWTTRNSPPKDERSLPHDSNVSHSSAVNAFVVKTAHSLFLTPEQKDLVEKLIDREYGKKIFQRAVKNRGRDYYILRVGHEELWDRSYKAEIEKILSEEQLKYWNIFVEPTLESLH